MATKIEIYNGALGKIGVNRVSSLTEDSEQRRKLDDQYPEALKATLEEYGWRFARTRVELARESATPAFGYSYQYTIPSDCVRILEVWNGETTTDITWEEEAGKVLTDEENFYIVYTKDITDVSKFPALFVETLQYKLASLVCLPLTNNRALFETMEALYQQKILKAQMQDAKKRSRRTIGQKSDWLTSRTTPVNSFVNVIRIT